tara:strand:+ start:78 stop:326 length:249 start_codon:yes stop_codon:yes gene_type:complete
MSIKRPSDQEIKDFFDLNPDAQMSVIAQRWIDDRPLTDEQKLVIVREGLEFVHFAIQEAQAGNMHELDTALEVLELMREEKL